MILNVVNFQKLDIFTICYKQLKLKISPIPIRPEKNYPLSKKKKLLLDYSIM